MQYGPFPCEWNAKAVGYKFSCSNTPVQCNPQIIISLVLKVRCDARALLSLRFPWCEGDVGWWRSG